jgi:hypothetical protein
MFYFIIYFEINRKMYKTKKLLFTYKFNNKYQHIEKDKL